MKFFHQCGRKIHIGINAKEFKTFCGYKNRFDEQFPTDFRVSQDGRIEFSYFSRRYGLEPFGQSATEDQFCVKCLRGLKKQTDSQWEVCVLISKPSF